MTAATEDRTPGTSTGGSPLGTPTGGRLPGAVAAEWTKAWTVRSTWWTLFAAAVLMGLACLQLTIFTVNANENDDPADDKGVVGIGTIAIRAVDLVQFVLIGLAMLLVTSEYSTGTIRATLQWIPRRGEMLVAKTLVVAVIGGVTGTVLAVAGSLGSLPLLGHWGEFETAAWLGDVLAVGAYMTLICVFSVGVATVLPSAVGTLIVLFLVIMVAPASLQASNITAFERVADFMPAVAGAAFMRGESETYPPALGLLILAAWAAAALAAAHTALNRRDA
ncbi:ABC transporter permease [Actinomadura sp. 7K507]|uniref:ABC transporter permease n=1 Tax=Actinomadura sp. 7K507 TaxID=2530365 RepID=UPI0010438C92|nr:ABC transporter permease [Actinomadura sp. 7K507]TDC88843.1 ABC transporter permease [Actinomadura sp. 7K507]